MIDITFEKNEKSSQTADSRKFLFALWNRYSITIEAHSEMAEIFLAYELYSRSIRSKRRSKWIEVINEKLKSLEENKT